MANQPKPPTKQPNQGNQQGNQPGNQPGNGRKPDGNDPNNRDPNNRDPNNRDPNNLGTFFSRTWFWIILAVAVLFGSRFLFSGQVESSTMIGLNEVAQMVTQGQVNELIVQGETVIVDPSNGSNLRSRKEGAESLVETLRRLGVSDQQIEEVTIRVEPAPNSGAIFSWVLMLLPMILIFAFFMFIMRQAGGGGQNRAMQFGRSRARKLETADRPNITFNDVAGSDEAKQELAEVVEFLKEPQKFAALGARIPKGVLMVGSPGTGKTLLAKAVAGEAGVPFFSSSGSEFVEMFVGVGASRVRDLFEQAKKNSPCIIFVDEIDAVGRHRGAGMGGGNDEREQTLNQILVEMDGFDTDTNIVIIAATNRPDILDPALLRPGRFDRKVVVDRPDRRGREAILRVHTRGKPLAPDIDLNIIASQTPGMVGADLENLVNEAAILAARRNKRVISMDEMVESIERILIGPARRSRIITDQERRVVAYHEAGHAIVFEALEYTDGVGKITIVGRGQANGYVMQQPDEDRMLASRAFFEDKIAGLLAGRVAEDLVFKEQTTGASDDLERATKMAKSMVTRYGMSDMIGPMQLSSGDANPFLGMELGEQRAYSEDVARKIDQEVRRIVENGYVKAREILVARKDKLVTIAETLLQNEVLDRREFLQLYDGGATAAAD